MFSRYRNARELRHFNTYHNPQLPGDYKWRAAGYILVALICIVLLVFTVRDLVEFNKKVEECQQVTLTFKYDIEKKIHRRRRLDDRYYHIYAEGVENPYLIDYVATNSVDENALSSLHSGDGIVCLIAESDDNGCAGEILEMKTDGSAILTLEGYKLEYNFHYGVRIVAVSVVLIILIISTVFTISKGDAKDPEFRVRRRNR